jgi:hypothetical protein
VVEEAKKFADRNGQLPATHTMPHEAGELAWPLHMKKMVAQQGVNALDAEFRRFAVLSDAERAHWLSTGLLAHLPDPARIIREALVCAIEHGGHGSSALTAVPLPAYKPGPSGVPQASSWKPSPKTPTFCKDASYMGALTKTVRCFTHADCCNIIRTSKGSLKTPPYLY